MIRFITFLLGREYETCKGCEVLKAQLQIANEEKKELTNTLLNLIKPKTYESPAIELQPSAPVASIFSRRRSALEAADREKARVLRDSTVIGKSDDQLKNLTHDQTIDELEKELEINNG